MTVNVASVTVAVAKKPSRKAKPKGRVLRTFEMVHAMNAGKEEQVRAVYHAYVPLLVKACAMQYQRVLSGEKIYNCANPKLLETTLSERYKRSANNQACETLSSWAALVGVEVRKIIKSLTHLSHQDKSRLLYVNAAQHWYHTESDGTYLVPSSVLNETTGKYVKVADRFDVVSVKDMKLLRSIVKHVRKHRVRLPNLRHSRTMKLDGIVCQWEASKSADRFDYWLLFSTLTKGKPILLPVRSTFHEQARTGVWTNATQITVPKTGPVIIRMVKDVTPETRPIPTGGVVGLDWGMKTLFAASEGDLMGQSFYTWLLNIDSELTALTAALQRQGIKPSNSHRYRAMQSRIRAYAKNEINRTLNRIVDLYDPSMLVVEELDFRHGGLSKRLNRIISRTGRSQVKQKLQDLSQDVGLEVVVVPAPYSSQECVGCGFVDDRNRVKEDFRCKFCGRKGHADIEAARTVKSRRTRPSVSLRFGKSRVLQVIDEQFTQRWGTDPKTLRALDRRVFAAITPTRPNADGLGETPDNECLIKISINNAALKGYVDLCF
jgi:putative transposase